MSGILIVDDTAVDRRLAGGLLESDPALDVSYANDVTDALSQISNHLPDLVVTDLQMPEYDGLHLVNEINEKYPEIPVVLITAHGSENIAAQALASGAASYVPKSDLANSLYETVMYVLSLSQSQSDDMKLMSCVKKSDLEFVLDNNIELVDPLIDMIQGIVGSLEIFDQRSQVQLGVALESALTNAMFRGNLAMSRDDFPVLSREAIASRSKQDPYIDRKVHFRAVITPEKAEFSIRDEGDGFDTTQLPEASNPESFRDGIGRGLVLIQAFMDDITFSDSGRQLEIAKHRINTTAATPK